MTAVRRLAAVEWLLLKGDPYPVVIMIAMPLVLLAFLSHGLVGGPGQAVPGLLLLFAFLGLYNVGMVFFRDHSWQTWSRLRTTPMTTPQIIAGKVSPLIGLYLIQGVFLLAMGWLLFDMPFAGDPVAMAVLVLLNTTTMIGLGMVVVVVCQNMNQVSALTNLGGLVLSGLGGALAPVSTLPGWAQGLARADPVYWTLQGMRDVVIRGAGLADVTTPLLVLVATSVVTFTFAAARFRVGDEKEYLA